MDAIEKIVDGVAGYFEQLKSARIEFWLNKTDKLVPDSINGIVTAFAFVLARSRFQHPPTPAEYGTILIIYAIAVCILGGICCLLIKSAAAEISQSIRAFFSTIGIVSTIGGVLIALRVFPTLTDSLSRAWFAESPQFGDPDVIAAAVPAALVGIVVLALIGRAQKPAHPPTSWRDWGVAAMFLFVAAGFGLGIIIGLGRGS